jgi:ferrochelatase
MRTNKYSPKRIIGVILMTYGSPSTLKDVPQYLKNVYGGKDPASENVAEFKRRYKLIGMSPLIQITKAQASALETELHKQIREQSFHVVAGMRFSKPYIADVIAELGNKVDHIVGIIMSPQYSPIIMRGYNRELTEAVANVPKHPLSLSIAEDWHLQPLFISSMAERVTEALTKFPESVRDAVPVLFSAHSMPKRVIDKEPGYIDDLKETAAAIAKAADIHKKRWLFCYQSAGHTPEEWLKPDFADIMPELEKHGQKNVLIAPVQFLADHLEILYDVEIGAREQAEEHGITFARTESLNTSPLFIKALADIVKEHI